MPKYIYLYISLFIVVLFGCQTPRKELKATPYNPAAPDFSFFLDEALKDVQIIALGESSHGFGSMHTLKTQMVKHLHQKLGYDVLVLEAGYADVNLAWLNGKKDEQISMLNGMMPSYLRTEQMLPIFTYALDNRSSENPLEIQGMDPKTSGQAFKFRLINVIGRLEPKIIQDSITKGFTFYNKTFETLDNQEEWQKSMDRYVSAVEMAKSILEESRIDINEMEIAKEDEVDILINYLDMLLKVVDYEFGETYTKGLYLRDSIMAENVSYLAKEKFPNAKIIVWGHNGHIEKGPGVGDNIKWLGHHLKERFGDKYYALGMYAKKGYIYQVDAKKTSNFDLKDPSFIESKITSEYGKDVFLDLPKYDEKDPIWVNQPIYGYELEAGGRVQFIPTKRFDGVMLLGETEGPIFQNDAEQRRR